ncbi:MAG TPA: carbohydrate binding family 9 domain-containing protein [Armatimonadota bacterium]|jgi:hypothetical protein
MPSHPHALALAGLLVSAFYPCAARAVTVNGAVPNPRVPGVRAASPPTVDGVPDDPCWANAPVISGFTADTKPPSFPTEVRALYDDRALYLSFVCHDPQPGALHAQQRKRNGDLSMDDLVEVGIDAQNDKRNAYWFAVNPLGTMAEDIPGGSAAKVEWRGDWQAAAKVTAEGWTAEIAIPFGILRYPKGQRTFGLMFARNIARHMEWSNWPANTEPWQQANQARWTGVEAPRRDARPRVMPYVLAGSGSFSSSAGLDVKYTAENNVTSLFTLRPDFQTVEESVQSVDFSYNPKYVEDRRPFFTEGEDFFGSYFGFYSPAINKVDAGAKTFGKVGPWNFAGLATGRNGEESDAVGYLRYEPSSRLSVWGGTVNQRLRVPEEWAGSEVTRYRHRNSAVSLLGGSARRPMKVGEMGAELEIAQGTTTGPGGDGGASYANVWRDGGDGVLSWGLSYITVAPDFFAPLAYIDRTNIRKWKGGFTLSRQVKQGPIRQTYARFVWDWTDQRHGGLDHRGALAMYRLSFRNDTSATAYYEVGTKRNDDLVETVVDGQPEYNAERVYDDRLVNLGFSWRDSDIYQNGNAFVRAGRLAGGQYVYGEMFQGARLGRSTSGSLSASVLHLDGALSRQRIWRGIGNLLYEFSSERSLAARVIVGHEQTNDNRAPIRNAYIAYRQELRRGADIFVLFGDPNVNAIRSAAAMKYVVTY